MPKGKRKSVTVPMTVYDGIFVVERKRCGDRLLPKSGAFLRTKIIPTGPSICTQPKGGYHWGGYN